MFALLAKDILNVHPAATAPPSLKLLQPLLAIPVIDLPLFLVCQHLVCCTIPLSGTNNRFPPQTLNPSLTISFRIVSWTPSTVVDLGEALGGLLVVGILVGVVL
jgi:hypothetical protein